jgi:hypothetical protein
LGNGQVGPVTIPANDFSNQVVMTQPYFSNGALDANLGTPLEIKNLLFSPSPGAYLNPYFSYLLPQFLVNLSEVGEVVIS